MKGSTHWKVQRFTAIIMLLTFSYITFFTIVHWPLTYSLWAGFIKQTHIQILLTISFISLVKHAWLGMHTVLTDYVKHNTLRHVFFALIITMLSLTLIYTLAFLWRP